MIANTQNPNEVEPTEQYFFIGTALLLGFAYMFSPLLSYVGALLCLTVFSSRMGTVPRVALSVVGILSGASIGASRLVGRGLSDDFAWYYDVYSRSNIVQWTERIPQYEIGLPLLIRVLRVLLPGLSPNGLMFLLSTLAGLLLLFFVERFGLRDFPKDKRAYCVGMVLLFFSFVLSTQLIRQMLSSVVLAATFFFVRAKPKLLTLLLASAFHVSALLVYPLVRAFQRGFLWALLLLVSIGALAKAIDVDTVIFLVTRYNIPRVDALFTLSDVGDSRNSLGIILLVSSVGLMSLFLLKVANAEILPQEKRTIVLLLSVIVVYLLALNSPIGPFRLFLVLHAVLAGWFFAFFTRRFPNRYLAVVGVAVILAVGLWKNRSLYVPVGTSEFAPWKVYSPFGAFPGYFVLSYIST